MTKADFPNYLAARGYSTINLIKKTKERKLKKRHFSTSGSYAMDSYLLHMHCIFLITTVTQKIYLQLQ